MHCIAHSYSNCIKRNQLRWAWIVACASSSPCCANSIQNKTEPNLRKKSIRICFFWSDSLTKPSVINDNILDFKIRFLLLLIMKLSLLLYFPFATTILKALDGCPFSALNDFFCVLSTIFSSRRWWWWQRQLILWLVCSAVNFHYC